MGNLRNTRVNQAIKFTHDEVEALLRLLNDLENDYIAADRGEQLTIAEQRAKAKLKRIYARQILSHEKRENEMKDSVGGVNTRIGEP